VVASGVRRLNQVTLRSARLVLGWVTVFGRVCNQASYRSTQPCILLGSLNRVLALTGWSKCGNVPGDRQVTLCDPIWHVT